MSLTSPTLDGGDKQRRPRLSSRDPPSNSGERIELRQRRLQNAKNKHVILQPPSSDNNSPASSIYRGSYNHGSSKSRTSLRPGNGSTSATPRMSISSVHLADILHHDEADISLYGLEEIRDGFFDGSFLKPGRNSDEDLEIIAKLTLPVALRGRNPLSVRTFFPHLLSQLLYVVRRIATTRAGVRLTKSFLAFFITYLLVLIPKINLWLGRYDYFMVISAIINHPGRPLGAQIDGCLSTILGSATGLGWGAFALWLSSSTTDARSGYGGVLATFLIIFMGTIAYLRADSIRLYQFVVCAGISISYTCIADTSTSVNWRKLLDFGIPWLLGQAISMLVCCSVFPDAGARPLAVSFREAFTIMIDGLAIPQENPLRMHRKLANTFVALSVAYRDLVIDVSVTRFHPKDVEELRNLMQGVIRSLLSVRPNTDLFTILQNCPDRQNRGLETVIDIDRVNKLSTSTQSSDQASRLVATKLADPTSTLLRLCEIALSRCDAVLMTTSTYRKYLGPSADVSSDVKEVLGDLQNAINVYDESEEALLASSALPPTYADNPEVVELFLFVRPVRQVAQTIVALLIKVKEIQRLNRGWQFYFPSYPWNKAFKRTNATVRHDRGGVTAGFFFYSQSLLRKSMKGLSNVYMPMSRNDGPSDDKADDSSGLVRAETLGKYREEEQGLPKISSSQSSSHQKIRYRIWRLLHRLQEFEMRFALKTILITSLLAIPAWLPQSRSWWNRNESWWAVAFAWIMMHPRVGGNVQDLVTRALCTVLGSVWGGLAYDAGNGNPYVMAVFAAIYMVPMMYRFTQSSHPRSGIVGCLSFVIVSLSAKNSNGFGGVTYIAWTRGVAFLIGVVGAVLVNWLLWPFVARHELRKALASMLIYSSVIYQGVVAKYVYYEQGHGPKEEDVQMSEMLEGRLREGFVRIRQLLALTRHEVRLRAPFDPLPFSALIAALEQFFENLVSIRQSSLFFHPHYLPSATAHDKDKSTKFSAADILLPYRRDAVASILMNLYILAGALRTGRKVPRYLPSAAAARRRLLQKMDEIEAEEVEAAKLREEDNGVGVGVEKVESVDTEESKRKWSQIYAYSYSQSLTGCVKELESLELWTKQICGEQGFDPIDMTEVPTNE